MTILFVGIILILYGMVAKQKYSVWGGMFFVLLIMGFQEGVPGDYMGYKYTFMQGGAEGGLANGTVKEAEFAFVWLTQTLSGFMNFHSFVLLTSFIQCLIMGLMIKNFADKRYHYFGVLLIFFTFGIMLIQMKAMRQGYAMCMMLFAYFLLGKHKFMFALLAAIIAYGFHNSSIIFMPFFVVLWVRLYFQRKEKRQNCSVLIENKKGYLIALEVLLGFFIFYSFKFIFFDKYVNPFLVGLSFFEYSHYLEQLASDKNVAIWMLFYHAVMIYVISLYSVYERDLFRKYLSVLTIVAMFLSVGLNGYGDLMRVPFYLILFNIVVFPNVASMLQQYYGKKLATGFVLFNMMYVMSSTVRMMISVDTASDGTGFATYTFSFLNW